MALNCASKYLSGWPDVCIVMHGQHDLNVQNSIRNCSIHGVLVTLSGLDILDWIETGDVVVPELLHILAGEPERPPHKIRVVVIGAVPIDMRGGVECGTRRGSYESVGNQKRNRSLVLNVLALLLGVSHESNDGKSVGVSREGQDGSGLGVTNSSPTANLVCGEVAYLAPSFVVGGERHGVSHSEGGSLSLSLAWIACIGLMPTMSALYGSCQKPRILPKNFFKNDVRVSTFYNFRYRRGEYKKSF